MAKVADGIRYAERVVAGNIIACEFVRLACQRFLDDLKFGEERGVYFSEPRAQHILNFYKFVPHVKGALAGQPIELMDWHIFILINIFGFVIPLVNEETGEIVLRNDGSGRPVMVRRFRTAYNEVARKNAKSTLSSGVGLYMTGADSEVVQRSIPPRRRETRHGSCLKMQKTWSKRPGQRWASCLSSINWLFIRSKPPPNLSRYLLMQITLTA
jgi:hypothetical protein